MDALFRMSVTGLIALACLTPGCEAPPSNDAPPEAGDYTIHTDESGYEADVSETHVKLKRPIRFTFTNRAPQAVYVPSCQGAVSPILEKWVAGLWVFTFSPPRIMCRSEPLEIAPGDSHTQAFHMSAGRPGHPRIFAQWAPERVEGTYRLVWQVYRSREAALEEDTTALVLLDARTSNPFRIRVD